MPLWSSDELRSLTVAPERVAADVLASLGLEQTSELIEVATLGVRDLDAALALGRPEPLADHLRWQRIRLHALGADHARDMLPRALLDALASYAEDAVSTLHELLTIADALAAVAADEAASQIASRPFGPQIEAYLERALAGDSEGAAQVLSSLIEAGTSLESVLGDIVEVVQIEVGRRWETGALTVAQEHRVTATTRAAMTRLLPHQFPESGEGPRLLAACATGSEHDVGLRIVTDLLRAEGWSISFVGGGLRAEDLSSLAAGADVVAISASMADQLPVVRDMIRAIRSDFRTRSVPVAVGGQAFRHEILASGVGADGSAIDARSAIELCSRLAQRGRPTAATG